MTEAVYSPVKIDLKNLINKRFRDDLRSQKTFSAQNYGAYRAIRWETQALVTQKIISKIPCASACFIWAFQKKMPLICQNTPNFSSCNFLQQKPIPRFFAWLNSHMFLVFFFIFVCCGLVWVFFGFLIIWDMNKLKY